MKLDRLLFVFAVVVIVVSFVVFLRVVHLGNQCRQAGFNSAPLLYQGRWYCQGIDPETGAKVRAVPVSDVISGAWQ